MPSAVVARFLICCACCAVHTDALSQASGGYEGETEPTGASAVDSGGAGLAAGGSSGGLSPRLVSALEDLAGKQAELEHQVRLALYRTEGAVRQEQLTAMQTAMMSLEMQFKRLGSAVPPFSPGHLRATASAGVRTTTLPTAASGSLPVAVSDIAAPSGKVVCESELSEIVARLDALEALLEQRLAEVEAEGAEMDAAAAAGAVGVRESIQLEVTPVDPSAYDSPVRVQLRVRRHEHHRGQPQDASDSSAAVGGALDVASASLGASAVAARAATLSGDSPVKGDAPEEEEPSLGHYADAAAAQELAELRSALSALMCRYEDLAATTASGAQEQQRLSVALLQVQEQLAAAAVQEQEWQAGLQDQVAQAVALSRQAAADMVAVKEQVEVATADGRQAAVVAAEVQEQLAAVGAREQLWLPMVQEQLAAFAAQQQEWLSDVQDQLASAVADSRQAAIAVTELAAEPRLQLQLRVLEPLSGDQQALLDVFSQRLSELEGRVHDAEAEATDSAAVAASVVAAAAAVAERAAGAAAAGSAAESSLPDAEVVEDQLQTLAAGMAQLEAQLGALGGRVEGLEAAVTAAGEIAEAAPQSIDAELAASVRAAAAEAVGEVLTGALAEQLPAAVKAELEEALALRKEEEAGPEAAVLEQREWMESVLSEVRAMAEQAASAAAAASDQAATARQEATEVARFGEGLGQQTRAASEAVEALGAELKGVQEALGSMTQRLRDVDLLRDQVSACMN